MCTVVKGSIALKVGNTALPDLLLTMNKLDTYTEHTKNSVVSLFVVVSLDTPVLPVKQWEEHLKLRELVEKIREKQTGIGHVLSLFL